MRIGNITADFEACPSGRVGFSKYGHAPEVRRVDIISVPIDDVAEGAILERAFPSAALTVIEIGDRPPDRLNRKSCGDRRSKKQGLARPEGSGGAASTVIAASQQSAPISVIRPIVGVSRKRS